MDFEPQKFFIGLMDFFSILLPGALLTYFLKDGLGPLLLEEEYAKLAGGEGWVAFFFSSYLLGHFVFLFGSLLDGHVYENIREATINDERKIKRLAKGKKLSSPLAEWLSTRWIKPIADTAVGQAVKIKEHYLEPLNAADAINTFQWCKAKLTFEHPEALAAVQRFEADSKFFRSFLVVLCVLVPWGLFQCRPGIALSSVFLAGFAFWRYVELRVKATTQAYWYLITLEANGGKTFPTPSPQADKPSRAGGVVFKKAGGQVHYLLVQTKNSAHKWGLPEDQIKNGEEMKETAVRGVFEETGVWARITRQLEPVERSVADEPTKVQLYLMEAIGEGTSHKKRITVWLPFEEALETLKEAKNGDDNVLLKLAKKKMTNPSLQPR